jgi:hypothetical protein
VKAWREEILLRGVEETCLLVQYVGDSSAWSRGNLCLLVQYVGVIITGEGMRACICLLLPCDICRGKKKKRVRLVFFSAVAQTTNQT